MANGEKTISKKRQQTAERIVAAIKGSNGLLTLAARKAGLNYSTVWRYSQDFATVKQAMQEAKESMTDFAEGKLFKKIKDGDTTAIIFYLKTKGRDRGYIEKQEVESLVKVHRNLDDYSTEELLAIAEGRARTPKAKASD